jgi:cytochrome c553
MENRVQPERSWVSFAIALSIAAALAQSAAAAADVIDFDESIVRIDDALHNNPRRVSMHALESCLSRRNSAVKLEAQGQPERARRSLKYCFKLLKISETSATKKSPKAEGPSMEELQAQAAREVEQALSLTPNHTNGLEIYRGCAMCHGPEGWGLSSGSVPQIAGQHRKVVIKQLADTRAGNRENFLMLPYSSVESIGGAQAVADVAGYIDTLEISVENGKGTGKDLVRGERLYRENCARCHGPSGAGDDSTFIPRIQAQHYEYLVRQFESIRDGKRRNANAEMVVQIQGFDERDVRAVMDYVSRQTPPEALQAPPGWSNPDFDE